MNAVQIWLLLVLSCAAAGLGLWSGWRRGELNPPDLRIGLHGGLAILATAFLLLTFDAKTQLGNPQLVALVLVVGSGAMMFGARRRARQCPPLLLWIHVASFGGLCLTVLA